LFPILSVTDGDTTRTFIYHADGQLASATVGTSSSSPGRDALVASDTETFLWDGLALVRRGDEQFVNEPHVGNAPKKLCFEGKPRAKRSARRARKGPRGNPVASSKGTSYFNDALGTTVGSKQNGKYSAAALTAFGESLETLQGEVTSNIKHQDRTCPAHYDSANNAPKTWFGTWLIDWRHYPELFLYVPDASIREYKSWVEGVFHRVLLDNVDLINEIFE